MWERSTAAEVLDAAALFAFEVFLERFDGAKLFVEAGKEGGFGSRHPNAVPPG